jgi:hypothetical protein
MYQVEQGYVSPLIQLHGDSARGSEDVWKPLYAHHGQNSCKQSPLIRMNETTPHNWDAFASYTTTMKDEFGTEVLPT